MLVKDFINEFKNKRIQNSKVTPNGVEDFIAEKIKVVHYIPFTKKREIVASVIEKSITEEYGIKHVDNISQSIGFIMAMLMSYTNLEFSDNPIDDYDALSEAGVLEVIVSTFKKEYDECGVLLKMMIAEELEGNSINAIIARFLNGILDRLDGVLDLAKGFVGENTINDIFGDKLKEEDITKVLSFIDKLGK